MPTPAVPALLALVPTPEPRTPADPESAEVAADSCASMCQLLLDWTGNESTARIVGGLFQPLLEVLVVFALAVVVRGVVHRLIRRLVESMKDPNQGTLSRLADRMDGVVDPVDAERRARRAQSVGALLTSVSSVVIWTFAVMMALASIDINLGPLIAGAGIVGIALGFGAQDLVKDFLSGVFMLIEDQYGVGDVVDLGEASGQVEGISLRTTRLRDVEGKLWHIPNGEIRRVANASQAWARALLDVDVAYDTDIDHATRVILEVGHQMATEEPWSDLFLEEPEVWGVQALAADSVQLRIVIKTKAGEQFKVGRELRRRLKYGLDAAGIEIPFQQRTVWVRNDEAGALAAPAKPATKPTKPPAKKATARRPARKPAKKATSAKKAATKKAAASSPPDAEARSAAQEV